MRELENVVERAIIVCRGAEVTAAAISTSAAVAASGDAAADAGFGPSCVAGSGKRRQHVRSQARLHEQEKSEIVAAIERNQGNIAGAARALGINRSTLYYRLRKHGARAPLADQAAASPSPTPGDEPDANPRHHGSGSSASIRARDTTLVIIEEARRRGHAVEICARRATLWLDGGEAAARVAR